jgi:hypothetical protein
MKSRKIWILDLISDKIEAGDSKREVMYICFGHPTMRKIVLFGALYGRTAMTGHGELAGEGNEGRGDEQGAQATGSGEEGGAWGIC